jgi:hypothetical protein
MVEGLIVVLIALVILVALAWVAKYIIDSFMPPGIRTPALVITGLILLLVLLVVVLRYAGLPGGLR